jgi:lactoylglutathione lyase
MQRLNYVIVFVSDMKRSVAFYRDVLGLSVKFETPYWTELANEGTTIALHPADSVNPEAASEGHAPAGTAQLAFNVDNLADWHQKLQAAGVRCILPPRDTDFGIRQALYADPDGLAFTVAETVKK